MRNPNGYGSVVNLGTKRRKPYAIRITYYVIDEESGVKKQKFKYLGYYEKSKDATIALAQYNSGLKLKEHVALSNQPTFTELYDEWMKFKLSRNKKISAQTQRNYNLVYGWCEKLHNKKFRNIVMDDIQEIADMYKEKSESTVSNIKTVLNQMYEYAMKRDKADKNFAILADWEWVESEEKIHAPFTDDEIKKLWDNVDKEDVDLILMMIYTGFRASEFIAIENLNINLNEKYVVGGMKTEAGINRTVALNNKVLPLFTKRYSNARYLIPNSKNKKYTYGVFYLTVWKRIMSQLGMDHLPHDTRHTFATLLDRAGANDTCIKLLMGHSVQDITKGVYTHKTLEDLLEAVNML